MKNLGISQYRLIRKSPQLGQHLKLKYCLSISSQQSAVSGIVLENSKLTLTPFVWRIQKRHQMQLSLMACFKAHFIYFCQHDESHQTSLNFEAEKHLIVSKSIQLTVLRFLANEEANVQETSHVVRTSKCLQKLASPDEPHLGDASTSSLQTCERYRARHGDGLVALPACYPGNESLSFRSGNSSHRSNEFQQTLAMLLPCYALLL